MDELSRRLAKKLRALRGDYTLREFSRKTGISYGSLNRIEQCKQNVTVSTLQKLCTRLKCDVGELFETTNDRRKPKD